ncbi:MAG: hypothetical protein EPO08_21150 [Rhodospirillaceae bacterium]|nr:MAG: hypothetical protein EPO08_21150 [Rhodospirillaceae bacterium]
MTPQEEAERPWFIYVLYDPRNGAVRYLGWTINPKVRFRDHLKPSRLAGHQRRDHWIKSLVDNGLRPGMAIIEVGSGEWGRIERKWIAYFRFAGADLTNLTDGGEGALGRRHTEAARAAMSAKRKGRKPSPLAIQRTKELRTGVKRSAELCAKVSAALKGKKKSPEHRTKLSLVALARPPMSVETRQKKRLSMLGKGRGVAMSAETKMKLRAAMLGRGSKQRKAWWATKSPEERSAIAHRGRAKLTPEQRSDAARLGHQTRRERANARE